jgi:hypothetical protein
MKIKGKAWLDGETIDCFGEIKILSIEGKMAYASWHIWDNRNIPIASLSRQYYTGDINYSKDYIIKMVLDNILKYKPGRRKIFTNIEIID